MRITRTPVPDPLTINKALPPTRISPLPNLSSPREISPRYIESVDVAGNHSREEEERVDKAVCPDACDDHYCQWWTCEAVSVTRTRSECGKGKRKRLTEEVDERTEDTLYENAHLISRWLPQVLATPSSAGPK